MRNWIKTSQYICILCITSLKINATQLMDDQQKFFFVRHGESHSDKTSVTQGYVDLPLNENGKNQALHSASILAKLNIQKVYSSHLKRAIETAECIASALKAEIHIEQDLQERFYGNAVGISSLEKYHQIAPSVGCGKNEGEDGAAFNSRVLDIFRKIIIDANDQDFIIVAHSKVFQTLAKNLCYKTPSIDFGQIYIFYTSSKRATDWHVKPWNG